ncbi:MAG: hypothetical protein AB9903_13965 [Vulcanimicrobiota bacterium]
MRSRIIFFQLDSGGTGWEIPKAPASISLDYLSNKAFDKPPVVFLFWE